MERGPSITFYRISMYVNEIRAGNQRRELKRRSVIEVTVSYFLRDGGLISLHLEAVVC